MEEMTGGPFLSELYRQLLQDFREGSGHFKINFREQVKFKLAQGIGGILLREKDVLGEWDNGTQMHAGREN